VKLDTWLGRECTKVAISSIMAANERSAEHLEVDIRASR
jgi:hypothetical protein